MLTIIWVIIIIVNHNLFAIVMLKIADHTDHHNKYHNNDKAWNTVRTSKMWHRDMKWVNAVGKMVPIDLLDEGPPQTFTYNFLQSAVSVKYNKWAISVNS